MAQTTLITLTIAPDHPTLHTQMAIVNTPNPVHYTPNLAIAHRQSWLVTPNAPYTRNAPHTRNAPYTRNSLFTPNLVLTGGVIKPPNSIPCSQFGPVGGISQDWGYNQAPRFCTIPPIWSIEGMSQEWGYNQAPQLCTDPRFGPFGSIRQG